MFFFDSTMILLIPAILLAIYAQYKVSSSFKKYSKVASGSGYSGAMLAEKMLSDNRVYGVSIVPVAGSMTDHYNPTHKSLALSETVYGSRSIAALAVAAHEVGHAIQHNRGFFPLTFRNAIFPVANLGSSGAFFLFFIGMIASMPFLVQLGIYFFSFAVAFHIITLPVEFDASRRGIAYLKESGMVTAAELPKAKSVLTAAALTYVASTLMAVLQLVRMILLSRDE